MKEGPFPGTHEIAEGKILCMLDFPTAISSGIPMLLARNVPSTDKQSIAGKTSCGRLRLIR